ncbi:unnamed protein product [Ranitomeya imitator]|uniref:Translocon-associated protein subunit delta n=1 Tax=Ranitomeya imitator TaxID=111125 RepID=A0ABN9MB54_9NEOB|nr:unnamed protein product [Ranitomeya imitator]
MSARPCSGKTERCALCRCKWEIISRYQRPGRREISGLLARSGTYEVKFFDEESYSLLRKGAWNGPWVSTEVLAGLIGILLYYTAYTAKSNIQA